MTGVKLSKLHSSVEGESLIDIAKRYRLSSWRAVVYAPGNEEIRMYHGRAPLAASTLVRVPPRAYDLLQRRVFALHRVRPLLEQCFVAHEQRIGRDLGDNAKDPDLSSREHVRALLENLDRSVRADVERVQQACRVFVEINSGLRETHLSRAPDIRKYGRYVNPEAGICWLLEKRLADSWFGMWAPDMWLERWTACDYREAVRRATLYFGAIRSNVMQQLDRRLRQAQASMKELLAESKSRHDA